MQYIRHILDEKRQRELKFNPYEALVLMNKLDVEYKKLPEYGPRLSAGILDGRLASDRL